MAHYSDKGLSKEERIAAFDQEIVRQEDMVYGVALFFECLCIVHKNQPAVVETYRKQFRNVIQKGRERIAAAVQLRKEARQSPARISSLAEFDFEECQGHPQPQNMAKRAEALVSAYRNLFPGRPRSKSFTVDEVLLLIEEASSSFK